MLSVGIPLLLILALVGLVLYVRFYGGKPEVFVSQAEDKASFVHLKPQYVPAGYQATLNTQGTTDRITYAYEYLPDKSKELAE